MASCIDVSQKNNCDGREAKCGKKNQGTQGSERCEWRAVQQGGLHCAPLSLQPPSVLVGAE